MKDRKALKISHLVNTLFVVFVAVALTVLINGGMIGNYQNGLLRLICINIILATSLNVTVGCLGQINLGHAGFMAIGAYTAALFSKAGFVTGFPGYILALIVGGVVAGGFGILIGVPALRLRGDYLAIVTLAFGEIIRNMIVFL